jgi:hypothetical protein
MKTTKLNNKLLKENLFEKHVEGNFILKKHVERKFIKMFSFLKCLKKNLKDLKNNFLIYNI